MKRFGTLILAFCLFLALLSIPAFADGTSYYLEELDMSISIPDEFDVFTRDIKSDDPLLKEYGISKQDLDFMYENKVYLYAMDQLMQYELMVTMDELAHEDLNDFSDSGLNSMLDDIDELYTSNGITIIKSDIYTHSQTKFLRIHMSQPGASDALYSLQYHTIIDGKGINITLHSYSGQIGFDEEAIAKEIVDSTDFVSLPPLSTATSATPAFTFKDKVSGLSFTVPENWSVDTEPKGEDHVGTMFVSKFVDAPYITFASEDIYESGLGFAKDLVTRDMFENDILSAEVVADMFSCDESDVSLRTFGGKEYYYAEALFSGSDYGIEADYTTIYLLRCENGIAYIFHFFDNSDSAYYDDFVQLVSSCEYPQFEVSEADTEARYLLIGFIVLAVLLLTPAIYPLPIIIYRFAIRKKPLSKKKARIVALIYGLCFAVIPAFIAILTIGIFWLLAAVLVIMIAVNYAILKCGKTEEKATPIDAVISAIEDPSIEKVYEVPLQSDYSANSSRLQYCHMCGNKLSEDTSCCSKCGTRIK